MKGFLSRLKDPERKKTNGITVSELKDSLPAKPLGIEKSSLAKKPSVADAEESETKKAEDISRCVKLLRQMYTLDLRIWGMEHAVGDEAREREELKVRANALFAEVHRVVSGWTGVPQERWTVEEQAQIQKIQGVLRKHDHNRY